MAQQDHIIDTVQGTITRKDGTTTRFLITGAGWSQWDGTTTQLGPNVYALDAMKNALADHLTDPYAQD